MLKNNDYLCGMNLSEIKDKKVAVLLSGGVDSSVVVHELAQQGLHPDCFYIRIGPEEKQRVGEQGSGMEEEWDCSSEEDLEMATAVPAAGWRSLTVIGSIGSR